MNLFNFNQNLKETVHQYQTLKPLKQSCTNRGYLGSLEYKIKPARLKVSDIFLLILKRTWTRNPFKTNYSESMIQVGSCQNFKLKVEYGSNEYILVTMCKKLGISFSCNLFKLYFDWLTDEVGKLSYFHKIYDKGENLFKSKFASILHYVKI